MIIDSHTHIFPPEISLNRDRYLKADSAFAELYGSPSAKLASAEDLIDSMDMNGIDMSIVCGFNWSSHELYCESNNYILESISRYPQRLTGLAVLKPEEGDRTLYELERCARGGIKGLGEMRPPAASLDTSFDCLWTPLVRFLVENKMICLFHTSEPVGHPYPGKGDLTPRIIYPFIRRYPDLKTVLAHWGGGLPFYELMPEVKKAMSNVWFDTAASSLLYSPAIFEHAVDIIGAERVLFGSDYPLIPQKRLLDEIAGSNLDTNTVNNILGLNAARLLGLNDGD